MSVDESVKRWYADPHWWQPQGKNERWIDRLIVDDGALLEDQDVLNLGCFYPEDEIALGARAKSWTAVDFVPEVIERCRIMQSWPLHVHFEVADMRKLPFEDDRFDVVTDFSAGDHVTMDDWARVVLEVRRVLRSGGHFVVVFANRDGFGADVRIDAPGDFGYERRTSVKEMLTSLTRGGFEIERHPHPTEPRAGLLARKGRPMTLERERAFWKCAGAFPADKERQYLDHAAAQGFDEFRVGRRVLEYGCGGGSDAMSWARRGHDVWYCDIVEENLTEAHKRIKAADLSHRCIPWRLRTSDALPFVGRGFFDVVSSHGVLHHIEDPRPVLRAMRRAISDSRPPGRLIVMLYSPALRESFEETVRKLMKEKNLSEAEAFGECTDGPGCPYARAYSIHEARELLDETGFRLLETRASNKGLFLTYHAVPA